MGTIAQFLALCTAVLLALPAGWCCASPAPEVTETKSNVPPCCQSKHEEGKSSDSAPGNPHRNCECCWAPESSTAPSKTFVPDGALVAIPVAVVTAPITLPSVIEPVETRLLSASSPLHVLLCTWIC
jgi:hypothetical protein